MAPYVSNPDLIPASDSYADVPNYGRYYPLAADFRVEPKHVRSNSKESLQYWESVLDLCTEANMIYPADEGGRDVFALGSVIVKSSHLHEQVKVDYSYADANEVQAISIAKTTLPGIRVPDIYFADKINNRPVLVQERLPGVGLNVALPYLSDNQKKSFKSQARDILRQLHMVKPPKSRQTRDYVVTDPNILTNGRLNPREAVLVFSNNNIDDGLGFMHNDLTPSNCIVDNDQIVGLIDWEMAGYLGWKTAREIHEQIRCPRREQYVNANVSEEKLQSMMWWNDLYDVKPMNDI